MVPWWVPGVEKPEPTKQPIDWYNPNKTFVLST